MEDLQGAGKHKSTPSALKDLCYMHFDAESEENDRKFKSSVEIGI